MRTEGTIPQHPSSCHCRQLLPILVMFSGFSGYVSASAGLCALRGSILDIPRLTAVQPQSAGLASCDAAFVAELYIEQTRFADLRALDLHKLEPHSSLEKPTALLGSYMQEDKAQRSPCLLACCEFIGKGSPSALSFSTRCSPPRVWSGGRKCLSTAAKPHFTSAM